MFRVGCHLECRIEINANVERSFELQRAVRIVVSKVGWWKAQDRNGRRCFEFVLPNFAAVAHGNLHPTLECIAIISGTQVRQHLQQINQRLQLFIEFNFGDGQAAKAAAVAFVAAFNAFAGFKISFDDHQPFDGAKVNHHG